MYTQLSRGSLINTLQLQAGLPVQFFTCYFIHLRVVIAIKVRSAFFRKVSVHHHAWLQQSFVLCNTKATWDTDKPSTHIQEFTMKKGLKVQVSLIMRKAICMAACAGITCFCWCDISGAIISLFWIPDQLCIHMHVRCSGNHTIYILYRIESLKLTPTIYHRGTF